MPEILRTTERVACGRLAAKPAMRLPALALLILPLAPCASAGQEADPALDRLRRSPIYQSAMLQGAYRSGAWIVAKCEPRNPSASRMLGMIAAPVFDAEGQPQSGRWVEHVSVEGCGRPWRLNVLMMVPKPRTLATMPMAPGTTHADPVLQRDAAKFAFVAARIDPQGCKTDLPRRHGIWQRLARAGEDSGQAGLDGDLDRGAMRPQDRRRDDVHAGRRRHRIRGEGGEIGGGVDEALRRRAR